MNTQKDQNHKPLMPTATAVWLIDNTSLTFDQIANFCGLHTLEIEGIANDDVACGVKGFDPIASGQLTSDMIEKCQKDPNSPLIAIHSQDEEGEEEASQAPKIRTRPRYTPLSQRRERPDAIAWLLRNHPELSDGQIGKLIGTTKSTIAAVRNRTHWNAPNIKQVDPVSLGLCKQIDLDDNVARALKRKTRKQKEKTQL